MHRDFIDKKTLKSLHEKSNVKSTIHLSIHLLILFSSLYIVFNSNFILSIIFSIIYFISFSFLGWAGAGHEFSHYSVFKNKRINSLFLYFFSTLHWNNVKYFLNSHKFHHKYTLDENLDFEVKESRCLKKINYINVKSIINLKKLINTIKYQILNSFGIFPERLNNYINPQMKLLIIKNARFILFFHLTTILIFIYFKLYILILYINFGFVFFNGFVDYFSSKQHCDLHKNEKDIFKNSRTLNLPIYFSFLYWNMNYHVEHHLYPGIPFYNLPKLNKILRKKNLL